MLLHDQRAWSYFLPRLGPGPISTLEPEIVTGPELFDVVVKTLTEPRHIVTTNVVLRRRFMRDCPLDKIQLLESASKPSLLATTNGGGFCLWNRQAL